jgi:hypothetical protein
MAYLLSKSKTLTGAVSIPRQGLPIEIMVLSEVTPYILEQGVSLYVHVRRM